MTTFKNFIERYCIVSLDKFIKQPYKVEYSKKIRSKNETKSIMFN